MLSFHAELVIEVNVMEEVAHYTFLFCINMLVELKNRLFVKIREHEKLILQK